MKKLPVTSPVELKVEASVNPSESPERVITAVANVIECSPELRYGNRVIGRSLGSESLRTIYEQIRSRSAMGVLRRMLVNNRGAYSTWFLLNKQAAATGIVVMIEEEQESPLGPIKVTLNCEEIDALIDWL
ncbi:MAG: RNA-binding domain-containing protein, partial [Candidatus Nitrosopolaris sp.]